MAKETETPKPPNAIDKVKKTVAKKTTSVGDTTKSKTAKLDNKAESTRNKTQATNKVESTQVAKTAIKSDHNQANLKPHNFHTHNLQPHIVRVISFIELDYDDRQKIEEFIKKRHTQALDFRYELDSSILGGLLIVDGEKYYDGTLKSKIITIHKALIE